MEHPGVSIRKYGNILVVHVSVTANQYSILNQTLMGDMYVHSKVQSPKNMNQPGMDLQNTGPVDHNIWKSRPHCRIDKLLPL